MLHNKMFWAKKKAISKLIVAKLANKISYQHFKKLITW